MDLDKLAKLSCLKLKDEDRDFFHGSLDDVFEMMDEISSIPTQIQNDKLTQSCVLDTVSPTEENDKHPIETIKIDREEQYQGIHLEQGVFLAPKVIKKD